MSFQKILPLSKDSLKTIQRSNISLQKDKLKFITGKIFHLFRHLSFLSKNDLQFNSHLSKLT